MSEDGSGRRAPAYLVAVRYERPPVEGLPPATWSILETHAEDWRARDGARLIASFVESGGGAVAVLEEAAEPGAEPLPLEIYGPAPLKYTLDRIVLAPPGARDAFAAAMTDYWSVILARRPRERGSGPKARRVGALPRRSSRTGLYVAAGLAAALLVGLGTWGVIAPPRIEPLATASVDDAELAFQRAGGFLLMRPSADAQRDVAGQLLYRAYRMHPDGRREFVGMRLADGSEPAPPEPPPGTRGGGGGGGGMNHLRAISEGFQRGHR